MIDYDAPPWHNGKMSPELWATLVGALVSLLGALAAWLNSMAAHNKATAVDQRLTRVMAGRGDGGNRPQPPAP